VNVRGAVFRKPFVITFIISRLELIQADVKGTTLLMTNLQQSRFKILVKQTTTHKNQRDSSNAKATGRDLR